MACLRGILSAIVLLVNEQVAATATGTHHLHCVPATTGRVYDGAVKVSHAAVHTVLTCTGRPIR